MKEWTVDKEGRGDFSTIAGALGSAQDWLASVRKSGQDGKRARILVRAGLYREKLRIMVPGLEISGEGADTTRIVWDDCASRLLPGGEPMGTFNSCTVYVGASGVTLRGLSIDNDAGDGRIAGQAVALYADADLLLVEGCRLSARQDTLCTGPLPKNPVPKGVALAHPVAGLGEDEPALPFRQIFRRCHIEGDVDFIFGSAMALFEHCEIRSRARPPMDAARAPGGFADPDGAAQGWIAAPSTYPGQAVGFVFKGCDLSAEEGTGKVFLGRPWRVTGRAVFAGCRLEAHIAAPGWDDWGKGEARAFRGFAEYGSTGPGAPAVRSDSGGCGDRGCCGGRVGWAETVPAQAAGSEAAVAAYTAEALFGSAFSGR